MSQVSVATPFNIALEFAVAPFHRRLGAWAIDILVMLLYALAMDFFISDVLFFRNAFSQGVPFLLVSVPLLLYHLCVELAFAGQSFGKYAMGIRVISLLDGEPRMSQYLLRWLFRVWEWPLVFSAVAVWNGSLYWQLFIVGLLGIGVAVVIAISPRNQRLGDMAAGTSVVDLRSTYGLHDTLFQVVDQPDYQVMFPEVMRLKDRDINAIKNIIAQAQKSGNHSGVERVKIKIETALQIQSQQDGLDFLQQLLSDYNYLATR